MTARRVLVLGGGYLGVRAARAFVRAGDDVAVLTRSPLAPGAERAADGAAVHVADLAGRGALEPFLPCDHVLFAVGNGYPAQVQRTAWQGAAADLAPLLAAMEALRAQPRPPSATVLSSGGTVYGDTAAARIGEDHPTRPVGLYGASRVELEAHALAYRRRWDLPVCVVRLSNPYGAGQDPRRGQGLVAAAVAAALSGAALTVFGDGSSVRDYVHADDAAEALVRLSLLPAAPEVLNLGSGVGHSVADVLGLVRAASGRPLTVHHLPARPFDVRRNVLDTGLMERLGLGPVRPLPEGVAGVWRAAADGGPDDLRATA